MQVSGRRAFIHGLIRAGTVAAFLLRQRGVQAFLLACAFALYVPTHQPVLVRLAVVSCVAGLKMFWKRRVPRKPARTRRAWSARHAVPLDSITDVRADPERWALAPESSLPRAHVGRYLGDERELRQRLTRSFADGAAVRGAAAGEHLP